MRRIPWRRGRGSHGEQAVASHRYWPGSEHTRRLRGLAVVAAGVILAAGAGCHWLQEYCARSFTEARVLAEQARTAEHSGDLNRAVKLMRQALETNPEDPQLHREMAQLLLETGDPVGAIKHLQFCTEELPDDADSFVLLAEILWDQGLTDDANEAVVAALTADPRDVEALLMRANFAEQQQNTELALSTYHRLLAIEPQHVVVRARIAELQLEARCPQLAAPFLRAICQCSSATPEQRAQAYWSLGIAYGQDGRWTDAVVALAEGASRRTGEMTADDWYRLAYARSRAGDIEKAREDLRRALRINPQHQNAQAMAEALDMNDAPSPDVLRIGHSIGAPAVPSYW